MERPEADLDDGEEVDGCIFCFDQNHAMSWLAGPGPLCSCSCVWKHEAEEDRWKVRVDAECVSHGDFPESDRKKRKIRH